MNLIAPSCDQSSVTRGQNIISFFVKSRSLLFHSAAWFFIATLFCDGSNLDDLFLAGAVLHDDSEIVGAVMGEHDRVTFSGCWELHSTTGLTKVRHSPSLSHPLVRVIIDQDSPSLAADGLLAASEALAFLRESPAASFNKRLPVSHLHLLFHSLLI